MSASNSSINSAAAATANGSAPGAPRIRKHTGTPIDLTGVEGVDMLSPNERELCSMLRLLPMLYLSIKDQLLREQARLGYLKRAHARAIIKIDVNKTSKIYDFFVSTGWINPGR